MGGTRSQIKQERLGGVLLICAAAAALVAANSRLAHGYNALLLFELGPVFPTIGRLTIHALVADGLMAIFFLLVGMEVKREWVEGKLANPQARRLPIVAAIAGMVVPALMFLAVIDFDPRWLRGWAIPTATDIAFAVAVLAILGTHAPPSIKLMLVTIAVIDDVGAVLIIALAYTDSVNPVALGAAAALLACMALLNIMAVRRGWPYLAGFAVLWWLILASGVHATVAGVLAAMTIPLGSGKRRSTLEHLERKIHPIAMFAIVPLFGFVSAGVPLPGLESLFEPLPLAVLVGLFLGKQIGVFTAIRIGDALGVCCRPEGASWPQIYGASILCGIGFTMSLFIGSIAFPGEPDAIDTAKIGTLAGSLGSAVMGWAVLRASSPRPWIDDQLQASLRLFGFADDTAVEGPPPQQAPRAPVSSERSSRGR